MAKIKLKGKNKKRKSSKKFYTLITILLIFLLVLSVVLLIQLNLISNPLDEINSEPQLFNVRDECTLILGNLIHKIKDEGGCEMACKTECGVRDMDFDSFEFIMKEVDCHVCNCYCI